MLLLFLNIPQTIFSKPIIYSTTSPKLMLITPLSHMKQLLIHHPSFTLKWHIPSFTNSKLTGMYTKRLALFQLRILQLSFIMYLMMRYNTIFSILFLISFHIPNINFLKILTYYLLSRSMPFFSLTVRFGLCNMSGWFYCISLFNTI